MAPSVGISRSNSMKIGGSSSRIEASIIDHLRDSAPKLEKYKVV